MGNEGRMKRGAQRITKRLATAKHLSATLRPWPGNLRVIFDTPQTPPLPTRGLAASPSPSLSFTPDLTSGTVEAREKKSSAPPIT